MSWTNERIELLQKKLWLEGWSASRIAGELAHGITRNAVIGKVYRLGLSGRAKVPPGKGPLRRRTTRRRGVRPTGVQTVPKSSAIPPWLYTRW
jgi:GcrA cell cycle regulator